MGLRFRKSINLGGGFRINLSKSGVGYSWGVKGFRVTKTASGRTRRTYSIPGTGISYIDESGNSRRKTNSGQSNNVPVTQPQDVMVDIDSADIDNFQAAEYSTIIEQITKTIKLNRLFNIFLWCTIAAFVFPVFFILTAVGIAGKIFLKVNGIVDLEYEMDSENEKKYNSRTSTWMSLNQCNKMWQITQQATVSNRRVNAGAGRNINRNNLKFTNKLPYYLKTNVTCVVIPLRKEKLIMLPDKILIIRKNNVGVVSYENLHINVNGTRFIESEGVPGDSEILEYTWQYVNKNGSPDRRYNNNRQLPICLYAAILITSSEGLNVEIQCSNVRIAEEFSKNCLEYIKENARETHCSEALMEEIEQRVIDENGVTPDVPDEDDDPLLPEAIKLAASLGKISTSMVQRRLGIGYSRAARIIDKMEARGIISGPNGSKPREILKLPSEPSIGADIEGVES